MPGRAEPSGISLSAEDASLVKGMLKRCDRQHDIAAWFGVNGGRIGDISTGARFANVPIAAANKLPPKGPYLSGRNAQVAIFALEEAQKTISTTLDLIRESASKKERRMM